MSSTPRQTKRVDERGRFVEILTEGTWEAVIHGQMKPGAVLGHHYHKLTRMYFYLTDGTADIDVVSVADGKRRRINLKGSEGTYLEPGEAHAIRFHEASEFILVKSRRYDPADSYTYFVDEHP